MGDFLSKADRSAHMARIRAKNTGIERIIFQHLKRRKVYFSTHGKGIPGRPDIVFRRYKIAVFIDGDFWHGRNFAEWDGKLNELWRAKIKRNIERDREKDTQLEALGWKVLHLWGSDIKKQPDECVELILNVRAERAATYKGKE
jgi:DNA mismatch endonuclease, patch repair protein